MKVQFIFVMLLLMLSSCISRTRVVPPDQRLLSAESSDREQLLRALERKSKQVQTLQATLALDVSGGGMISDQIKDYRETKGLVVVERPQHIHFKVQAPLVGTTIADMVSDGREYRVSIPWENKFFIGVEDVPTKHKNPILNLKPRVIVNAMFVDITPYLNKQTITSVLEEAIVGRRRFYVFSFIDISSRPAQLIEKLWMDRTDEFRVARKQLFGVDGKVETDVEFSDYEENGDIDFPKAILIQRPVEDYTIKMMFQKTTLNDELAAGVFTLERPAGSELVEPVTETSSETSRQ